MNRHVPARWLHATILAALVGLTTLAGAAAAQSVELRVIVLHGYPGHAGVHLTRGTEQRYWDPGGNYGRELDECHALHSVRYCSQWYAGFDWEEIKAARRHDVFAGRPAGLMQVLAVEVLDYEGPVDVYRFRLDGAAASRAWQLLEQGAAPGTDAVFVTAYPPMFCTRAVSAFLRELGGPFDALSLYWRPEKLARALGAQAGVRRETYTLRSPAIQHHLTVARRAVGLGPLPMELALTPPDEDRAALP